MARHRMALRLERLEDRLTPASFGLAWPDPRHLTLSIVPDGTQTGNVPSQLFQSFGRQFSTAAWQTQVLRAFQTWSAAANLNIGLVADSGADVGTAGAFQGDTRFGDIRVAGGALSAELLGLGAPFDPTIGTWSGDIVLNNAYNFTIGSHNRYDLYTVALHEAGHALGIGDNKDPSSVMYDQYDGRDTGLSTADVAAIRALYGPRQGDAFAGNGKGNAGNNAADNAAALNISDKSNGYKAIVLAADITQTGEADYYQFTNPGSNAGGGVNITVQTGGISLLEARVTVTDSAQKVVASASATDPLTGQLKVRIPSAAKGAVYTVKVEGASNDVFGIGSYTVEVRLDSAGQTAANQVGFDSSSLSDDDPDPVFSGAKHLAQNTVSTDNRFDYTFHDSLSSPSDVNRYRFKAPTPAANTTNVMTIVVWAQQAGGLNPTVKVFDQQGRPVAAQVVLNENGAYDIQVVNATANANYYVAISAANPRDARNAGGYFLGVDFNMKQVVQQTYAQLTLTESAKQAGKTLKVNQTQEFHLSLTANSGNTSVETAVRMTIYDSKGNVVFMLVAHNGETRTGTVLLTPGTYTVRFSGGTRDGSVLPATSITLAGLSGTADDLGPGLVNPNGTSTGNDTTGGGGGGAAGGSGGCGGPSDPGYVWSDAVTYAFLSLIDPYGNPWW